MRTSSISSVVSTIAAASMLLAFPVNGETVRVEAPPDSSRATDGPSGSPNVQNATEPKISSGLLPFGSELRPGSELSYPNKVIGDDSRTKVSDTSQTPFRWIVLFVKDGEGFCSGSLIGEDTVVSAAHCIVDKQGKIIPGITFCPGAYHEFIEDDVPPLSHYKDPDPDRPRPPGSGSHWGSSSVHDPNETIPAKDDDGAVPGHDGADKGDQPVEKKRRGQYIFPYGCSNASTIFWDAKAYKATSEDADFALIHLTEPLGKKVGYFSYASEPIVANSTLLTITGYPQDKGEFDKRQYGDIENQWTAQGRALEVGAQRVWYDVDTFNGESGSPVYDSTFKIRAIHGGGYSSKNYGVVLTPERLKWMDTYTKEGGW